MCQALFEESIIHDKKTDKIRMFMVLTFNHWLSK